MRLEALFYLVLDFIYLACVICVIKKPTFSNKYICLEPNVFL